MRIVLLAVVLGLGISVLSAQPAPERKRMVFAPGAAEPVAMPTPTPTPTPDEKPTVHPSPQQAVELFFLALKAGQPDAAYDGLVRGTLVAERQEDVASLKERTKQALDAYGPVGGYEVLDDLAVGENLKRTTCLSLNSDLPLRWRFYFYRSGGQWRLVDLRVDDGLVELFEDAAKKGR